MHINASVSATPCRLDRTSCPVRTRALSGNRDYTIEAASRVDFIHRGQAAGLTLAQIRQILDIRDRGEAPCEHVRTLLDTRLTEIDHQIDRSAALRQTVRQLRDRAAEIDPVACGPERVCR